MAEDAPVTAEAATLAPSCGPLFQLDREIELRLVEGDRVEIWGGRVRRLTVPLALASTLSRFSRPRSPDEVFAALGGRGERRQFEQLLAEMTRLAILRRLPDGGDAAERSLLDVLDPAILDAAGLQAAVRAGLEANRVCLVTDAFRADFAEEVFRDLDAFDRWAPHDRYTPFFNYHHHNIYDEGLFSPVLRSCRRIFDAPATKTLVSELSGRDCTGPTEFSASLYLPGDRSSPHDDALSPRSVAFVWHLTRGWDPCWGGHLFWCSPPVHVLPSFNRLVLFNVVRGRSVHFVEPVAAVARGKRMAINGWWCHGGAADGGQQRRLAEARAQDARRHLAWPSEHVERLDERISFIGRTGRAR
jgi:hypothetical protein